MKNFRLDFANSMRWVGDVVLAIRWRRADGDAWHRLALARTQGISDYQFFIQTDAAINRAIPAALVDLSGQPVGINTAIFSLGRLARYRLRDPRQHGAGGGGLGKAAAAR